MPVTKLLHFAVGFQVVSYCLATEEACNASVTEEAGRAMMQLFGGPTKKTVSKEAPVQKSRLARAKTPDANNVALSSSGYKTIASMCCAYEMEEYIRRLAMSEGLKICNEGGLQATVPFHICENMQSYSVLLKEVKDSITGICPWTARKNEGCKKVSKVCGSSAEPMSHRRRNCGRNDNSHFLGLEMQNAATNEIEDSKCGTHQQFTDVKADSGIIKACSIKGDLTANKSAKVACLNECCSTNACIGIVVQKGATTLQKSFLEVKSKEGAIAYLHRQR